MNELPCVGTRYKMNATPKLPHPVSVGEGPGDLLLDGDAVLGPAHAGRRPRLGPAAEADPGVEGLYCTVLYSVLYCTWS